MWDEFNTEKKDELNPQLIIPEKDRKHCEKCKILLADCIMTTEEGKQKYICNRCYKPKKIHSPSGHKETG